ncbi:MAG: HupE/UreJ family protein [Halioglobus sp.]
MHQLTASTYVRYFAAIHCCLTIVCLALLPQAALSHDLGLARVDINLLSDSRLAISVQTPPGAASVSLQPGHCRAVDSDANGQSEPGVRQHWQLDCDWSEDTLLRLGGILEGAIVTTTRGGHREGVFVDSDEGVVSLRPFADAAGANTSVADYLRFGFEHILSGWDHLLFVLLLCLLATGWRLVKLVTAFTVGHSITLALAVLGFVAVAGPAVEACIALSIVFLARQVLANSGGLAHGYTLVCAFGMLHGLGFAGALVEAGLPSDRVAWALLAFNLGVEAGQLVFVALALAVFAVARRLHFRQPMHQGLAWLAGGMGCYWTLTRVLVG